MRWKLIPNTNYYVSSNGEVRKPNGNLMNGGLNSYGYRRVSIHHKEYLVHRLVAQAFIPNPNNLPQVNHIDGDKTHNFVDNLEWVDNYHNYLHAVEHGLRPQEFKKGVQNINSKLTKQDVEDIKTSNLTAKDLSIKYNMDISNIYKIQKGETY